MQAKTILFTMVLCILIFINARSQNISIGARGGLTIPNLSAGSGSEVNPLNRGYSSREGLGFGVFVEFKVSKLFSIQPMLEYSQQGGKKKGFQALTTPPEVAAGFQQNNIAVPPYLYADYNSEAKLNYLMLPVLAKFGWDLGSGNHWRIYVDAGPFASLLTGAHQEISGGLADVYLDADKMTPMPNQENTGIQQFPFNSKENIKDQLHKFNFGAEANAGVAYRFKKNSIFIEGGGNYGFLNIQKGTANGKNNSGAATAMIGYAYTL